MTTPSPRSRMADRQSGGAKPVRRKKGSANGSLPLVRWEYGELRWYERIGDMAPLPAAAVASEAPRKGCAKRTPELREYLRRCRRGGKA